MVEIERIPAEARWKLATHALTGMPVALNMAFRNVAGEKFNDEIDNISRRIWSEAAKDQPVVAKAFGLPVNNARNIGETLYTISKMYLGAELKGNIRDESGDTVMCSTESCPMYKRAREIGSDPNDNCPACTAYLKTAVESLNPDYKLNFIKGMCAGDPICEMRVESKK